MIKNKLAEGASSIIRNSPDARYIIERTTAISFLINIFEVGHFLGLEIIVSDTNVEARHGIEYGGQGS
jgi:hypothetical protein